ncbi:mucin-2-like [Lethenteron reissneri]|uniref:mucin-2-like n=1 Tax=Lethenteron reissneri TaxID=7753 RepID=UPI002AB71440|nr:mucin-2-like [Lethenteron reissneri]
MAQVNVQAYMESHRVHHLFKEMLSMLLLEMPHQPIPWLINHLQAKLEVSRCGPPGWALPYGGAEDGAMVLGDLDPAAYPSNVGGSDEEAVKSGSPLRSAVAPARSCETRKSHFVVDPGGGGGDGGHDSNNDTTRLQTGWRQGREKQVLNTKTLAITLSKGAALPTHSPLLHNISHDAPGSEGGLDEWLARGFTHAALHRGGTRAGDGNRTRPTLLMCAHCTRFLEDGDQSTPSTPSISPPPSSATVSNTLSRLFRIDDKERGDHGNGDDDDGDTIVEDLANESSDDFESASQVTGPRHPIWDTEGDTSRVTDHSARAPRFTTDVQTEPWATRVSDTITMQTQQVLHSPLPGPEWEGVSRSRPASSPGSPMVKGDLPRAEHVKAKSLCGEDRRDFDGGRSRKGLHGSPARPTQLSAGRGAGARNEMPFLEIKKLFPEPRNKTSSASSNKTRRNKPRSFANEPNKNPLSATGNVSASAKYLIRPLSPSNCSDLFEQLSKHSSRPQSRISQTSRNQSSRPHTPTKHSETFHQPINDNSRPNTPAYECGTSQQSRIRGSRPPTPVNQNESSQELTSNTFWSSTPISQSEPIHQSVIHSSSPQTPNSHRETSPQSQILGCMPDTHPSDTETFQRPNTKTSRPQTPISQSGGSKQPSGNPSRPQSPNIRSEAFQQIGRSNSRPQTPISGVLPSQDTMNTASSRPQSPANNSKLSQCPVGRLSKPQTPSNEREAFKHSDIDRSSPQAPINDHETQQQTRNMTDGSPATYDNQSVLPHHPIGKSSRPQTPNSGSETFQKPGTNRSRPHTPTSSCPTSHQTRTSTSSRPATPSNQIGLSHHPSGISSRPQTPGSVRGLSHESRDRGDDAVVTPTRDGRAESKGHPGPAFEEQRDSARDQSHLELDNTEASMQGSACEGEAQ